MRLTQLIYTSRPFGFEESVLTGILFSARRNNRRDGITGALICRADLYLQMLEGPRDLVTSAFGRILRDDRHIEAACIYAGDIATRLFPLWDMLDDPVRPWMWSREEVAKGAVASASAEDIRAMFTRIAAEPAGSGPI